MAIKRSQGHRRLRSNPRNQAAFAFDELELNGNRKEIEWDMNGVLNSIGNPIKYTHHTYFGDIDGVLTTVRTAKYDLPSINTQQ